MVKIKYNTILFMYLRNKSASMSLKIYLIEEPTATIILKAKKTFVILLFIFSTVPLLFTKRKMARSGAQSVSCFLPGCFLFSPPLHSSCSSKAQSCKKQWFLLAKQDISNTFAEDRLIFVNAAFRHAICHVYVC